MTKDAVGNYIRAHRRRYDLSQRELGILIGYGHRHAVGNHERSGTMPPLSVALAYEVIFEVPVGQMFVGFRAAVEASVVRNVDDLKADLEGRSGGKQEFRLQKSQWLLELQQRINS